MIEPECILSGDSFDPSDLIRILPELGIEKRIASGEIGTRGRYKGQPSPYGLGTIRTPDSIPVKERIKWLTAIISQHIETFRANGATDIEFNIHWSGLQGNMEFSAEELKGIADLGIPLTMDYMVQEGED